MGPDDPDCSLCLSTYDGQCVSQWAQYIGTKYNDAHVKYNQAKRQFGLDAKFSDCSSYTSTVLRSAGYECFLKALEHQTTLYFRTVERKLVGKLPNCGGFHLDKPQVGDLMNWEHGTTGHIGIIVDVNEDRSKVRFVAMGTSQPPAFGFTPADKWWDFDAATAHDASVNVQKHGLGGPSAWSKAGGFFSFLALPQEAVVESADASDQPALPGEAPPEETAPTTEAPPAEV